MSEAAPLTPDLLALAQRAGGMLRARRETIAVAEGAAGGLISTSLLSVAGASTFYLGGAVIYTLAASRAFMAGAVPAPPNLRGASEPWALYLAHSVAAKLEATWGIGEGGAAGPRQRHQQKAVPQAEIAPVAVSKHPDDVARRAVERHREDKC